MSGSVTDPFMSIFTLSLYYKHQHSSGHWAQQRYMIIWSCVDSRYNGITLKFLNQHIIIILCVWLCFITEIRQCSPYTSVDDCQVFYAYRYLPNRGGYTVYIKDEKGLFTHLTINIYLEIFLFGSDYLFHKFLFWKPCSLSYGPQNCATQTFPTNSGESGWYWNATTSYFCTVWVLKLPVSTLLWPI